MGMREKEIARLVDCLAAQGCTVKGTKSGHMIYFPNGDFMVVHRSEPRGVGAERNWRRRVKAAGLRWPGEKP